MEQLCLDGWILEFDAERTRAAYAESTNGAHSCTCSYCRNYVAVRDSQYSTDLMNLLDKLGIPLHKEAEVYEIGPGFSPGLRLYGGWYHFVGRIVNPGAQVKLASPGGTVWSVSFAARHDLAPESFRGLPLVQLDFTVELPWVLEEAPDS